MIEYFVMEKRGFMYFFPFLQKIFDTCQSPYF